MGVVSECCCKEVYYRYPHNNYYFSLLHLYYIALFLAASYIYSSCSFTPEIASETISENLESKNSLGEHAPRPPSGHAPHATKYTPRIIEPDNFKSALYGQVRSL